jgi:ABC-type multidrug transport system fused ATPase/permease subunit
LRLTPGSIQSNSRTLRSALPSLVATRPSVTSICLRVTRRSFALDLAGARLNSRLSAQQIKCTAGSRPSRSRGGPNSIRLYAFQSKCGGDKLSSLLKLDNVVFSHGKRTVLRSVSFSAEKGEFLALLGVNGAGNSTLLDIIAGFRKIDFGSVAISGKSQKLWTLREIAQRVSHLPQSVNANLHVTAEQLVAMVLALIGGSYLVWAVRQRRLLEEL